MEMEVCSCGGYVGVGELAEGGSMETASHMEHPSAIDPIDPNCRGRGGGVLGRFLAWEYCIE